MKKLEKILKEMPQGELVEMYTHYFLQKYDCDVCPVRQEKNLNACRASNKTCVGIFADFLNEEVLNG